MQPNKFRPIPTPDGDLVACQSCSMCSRGMASGGRGLVPPQCMPFIDGILGCNEVIETLSRLDVGCNPTNFVQFRHRMKIWWLVKVAPCVLGGCQVAAEALSHHNACHFLKAFWDAMRFWQLRRDLMWDATQQISFNSDIGWRFGGLIKLLYVF